MSVQKFTVSRDESTYEAWPDVVLTDGGKLICVFSECDHHCNRNNARIVLTESTDRGRTWSEKRPLTERGTREEYFNCARISRLRDGSLAIIADKIYGDENRMAEQYVWRGDAEGLHWSRPQVLPFCGIVPDKFRQLESGRLLVSAHFRNPAVGKLEQYLWYSDDDGKTWSPRITMAASPSLNPCEVSILECGNHTLVGFLRENSGLGYDLLKVFSRDDGETWGPLLRTSIDCGHRPVSGWLRDGSAMITYRFIPCGTQNLFAAFYSREAVLSPVREEQRVRILPLDYDRNPAPDLGYTGWVQFADGEIYVVNYIKDDSDMAYIRGYSFFPDRDVQLPVSDHPTQNVF